MAETRVVASDSRAKRAEPTIHHIWIGSAIAQNELDYARAWAVVNSAGRSETGVALPRYTSTVWVDPNALLELGINDVVAFDTKMGDPATRRAFNAKKLLWASRRRYELAQEIARLPSSNLNDGERAASVFAMRSERLGRAIGMTERSRLLDRLALEAAGYVMPLHEEKKWSVQALGGRVTSMANVGDADVGRALCVRAHGRCAGEHTETPEQPLSDTCPLDV